MALARSAHTDRSPRPAAIGDELVVDKLISRDDVCDILSIGRSTLYKWLNDPALEFPRPRKLGSRMSRWWLSAIMEWARDRPAA